MLEKDTITKHLSHYTKTETDTELAKKLNLTGGTMTGAISSNSENVLNKPNTTSQTQIVGGTSYTDGAFLSLGGKDWSPRPGHFYLAASNGTSYALQGTPSGSLTWGGVPVCVAETGAKYIKFNSGLMVQWGSCNETGAAVRTITFSPAFVRTPYIFIGAIGSGANNGFMACYRNATESNFIMYSTNTSNTIVSSYGNDWLAIGWWK